MNLLGQIQSDLLNPDMKLGTILIKLRFLAAKLGSDVLEEWVKHETDGYPRDVDVPQYRVTELSYTGTFSDGMRTLNSVPIASYIIEKEAGDSWTKYSIRDGIGVIESFIENEETGGRKLGIAAGNLTLVLQDKVYKGFSCIDIQGLFGAGSFTKVLNVVRARLLDLTLEIEKKIPEASEIVVGGPPVTITPANTAIATQVTTNIIYGGQTNYLANAPGSSVTVNVVAGDQNSLTSYLITKGVPEPEAKELTAIVASEAPPSADQPLGEKAKGWLTKVAGQTWDVTKEVGTEIVTEAIKKFFGL